MIAIRVTEDLDVLKRAIGDIGARHIPFATVVALTRTAQAGKDDLREAMVREIDRPTDYTLNSVQVRPATKANPQAEISLKEFGAGIAPAKYLRPQIQGGPRSQKRFERALQAAGLLPAGWYAVPASGAPFDAYGNVPGRFHTQILSALRASSDPMQNRTARSIKRRGRRLAEFFVLAARRGKLPPGIYQRYRFAMGNAVRPVFVFSGTPPTYQKRLSFYETIQLTVRNRFPAEFVKAFEQQIDKYGR